MPKKKKEKTTKGTAYCMKTNFRLLVFFFCFFKKKRQMKGEIQT